MLLRYYDPEQWDIFGDEDQSKEETESGRILLAGIELDLYNLAWLRSQIAIVSQDPVRRPNPRSINTLKKGLRTFPLHFSSSSFRTQHVFSTTILENVALGLTGTQWEYDPDDRDESRKQQIRAMCVDALKKAQAWEFVSALPEGIDTEVTGARAGVLSGGPETKDRCGSSIRPSA